MSSNRALIVVVLVAVAGVVVWRFRASLGIATANDAALARQQAIRTTISQLPRELTAKEIDAARDASTSLVENIGTFAGQGAVGGPWGAAGGAVVGAFKELFD
jgi:predicted negative regulator of RcsB-dependent stress response